MVSELGSETGGGGPFDRFRRLVAVDPALHARLWAELDSEVFVALVVELGESRGCRIDAGEIRQALQAGRRTWIERWLT